MQLFYSAKAKENLLLSAPEQNFLVTKHK